MDLRLEREFFDDQSTIGALYVNNVMSCYTLELPYDDGRNVPDQDCIPYGTYPVITDFSPHFGRRMPHVMNVPSRSEIRIHPANCPAQILGCIAVGTYEPSHPDWISSSMAAFTALFQQIDYAISVKKEQVTLRIVTYSPPPTPESWSAT
jgi:Steigviridae/Suoliviridae L,D-carboxypeptidase/transpeptidase